jgi:hypothetical protein
MLESIVNLDFDQLALLAVMAIATPIAVASWTKEAVLGLREHIILGTLTLTLFLLVIGRLLPP